MRLNYYVVTWKINDEEYTVKKAASTYKEILYNYIKSPMQMLEPIFHERQEGYKKPKANEMISRRLVQMDGKGGR